MEKRQLGIEKSPILITGCARSGTSMMAGIIDICGGFGGMTAGPNKHNAKGMFENLRIKMEADKPYLSSLGVDPKGQGPLPDTKKLRIPTDWKETVDNIILQQGYKEGAWYYKGARTCLYWPVWAYAYPNAKWIIVRRRSSDIADSCLKTAFMNKYQTFDEWIKWVNQHEKKWTEMFVAGLNCKQIWPERIIRGNYEQVHEMIEWLGLEWRPKEVMNFIEPKLWKARVKEGIIKN